MMIKQTFFAGMVGCLLLTVQALAVGEDNSGAQVAADIEVSAAYVRTPVPGRNITTAFFSLRNTAEVPATLVAVHAEFAGRAELHSHSHSDGMMRMRKEESVDIPAGGAVDFTPGGYHVMLFDLQRTLQVGDQLQLKLEFADGRKLLVPAAVRSAFEHAHH